jgi:hypothetical protein
MVDTRKVVWGVVIALLILIFIAGFVQDYTYNVPQNMRAGGEITGLPKSILSVIGIPSDWHYFPAIFYLFLVPFLGIFAIVFGFLRELKIFTNTRHIDWVLALVIAISIIPFGIFVRVVNALFSIMGMYSVIAFAALFFIGVTFITLTRLGSWGLKSGIADEFKKRQTYEKLYQDVLDRERGAQNNNRTLFNKISALRNDAIWEEHQGHMDRAIKKLHDAMVVR